MTSVGSIGPKTPPVRELSDHIRLALPLTVGYLGQMLMGLVDTVMLGHHSETALAGAGIANSLIFAFIAFGMGVVMGLDSLVPQAIGAGERDRARRLFVTGLRVCVVLGLPISVIILVAPELLTLVAVDPDVADEARIYIYGRLPSLVPFLVFVAQRSFLQAAGGTRPIVVAMVVANVVNVGLDYALIYGVEPIGLPALGSLGAALATTFVSFVSIAIAGLAIASDKRPATAVYDPVLARKIVALGLPVGLHLLAEVGLFSIAQVLAGRLGKTQVAAHQVAVMLASFSFSMALGVGAACSVRVGQAIGSGDPRRVRRAGTAGFVLGASLMGCAGIAFAVFPRQLATLVSSDPHVIEAAIPLLRIAAVFQLSDAIQAVAAGALRGAGDTRSTFIGNLAGHYGIGLPLAIILAFPLGMGVPGLWWGLVAGLTSVAIGLTWRFYWLAGRPIARS